MKRHQVFHRFGVTLAEILLAMLILGMAVLPIIRAFSQSYALAGRRLDQEIALKMAEATLNTLMGVKFDTLDKPSGDSTIPMRFETPSNPNLAVDFPLGPSGSDGPAQGTLALTVGKSTFTIEAKVIRVFQGVPPHVTPPTSPDPPLLYLTYPYNEYGPIAAGTGLVDYAPIASHVASYTCPDNFLGIQVHVRYSVNNLPQEFSTCSFRSNLNQ
jgi:hypothetical protein